MNRGEFLRLYTAGERYFAGVDLSSANLQGIELIGVDLSSANLSNIKFCGSELVEVNLSRANLSNANFDDARIINSNFTQANMSRANLIESTFKTCNLNKANLRSALLGLARLTQVTCNNTVFDNASFGGESCFENSDLTGASFQGCDFILPEFIPTWAGFYLILPDGRKIGESN